MFASAAVGEPSGNRWAGRLPAVPLPRVRPRGAGRRRKVDTLLVTLGAPRTGPLPWDGEDADRLRSDDDRTDPDRRSFMPATERRIRGNDASCGERLEEESATDPGSTRPPVDPEGRRTSDRREPVDG